jgi:hypothetical protein
MIEQIQIRGILCNIVCRRFIKITFWKWIMLCGLTPMFAFAQANDSAVQDYITKNPTDDLKGGVINAGGLPTIEKYQGSIEGQIDNGFGIHSGQYIVSFIILTMLKVLGVFALIGVLRNVVKLKFGGEDIMKDALKGIGFSVLGLIIVLFAHMLVTMIVQILNTGNAPVGIELSE